MHPILFSVGPVTIHTYGLFVAAGFLSAYFWLCWVGSRIGWPKDQVADLLFVVILSGIVGARLMYVFTDLPYFLRNPLSVLKIWQGGVVWYGGFIGGLLAIRIWTRRKGLDFLKTVDMAAPAVALGHGFGRIGCLAAGCCYGRPTEYPWGIVFTDSQSLVRPYLLGLPLHPTQIYEMVVNWSLFVVLALVWKQRYTKEKGASLNTQGAGDGFVAFLYVLIYAIARFAMEGLRGDERGGFLLSLSVSQWIAVLAVLSVLYMKWMGCSRSRVNAS